MSDGFAPDDGFAEDGFTPEEAPKGVLRNVAEGAGSMLKSAAHGAGSLLSVFDPVTAMVSSGVREAGGGHLGIPKPLGNLAATWGQEMRGIRGDREAAQQKNPGSFLAGAMIPAMVAPEAMAGAMPLTRMASAGTGILPTLGRAAAGIGDSALFNGASALGAHADQDQLGAAKSATTSPWNIAGAVPSLASDALGGVSKLAGQKVAEGQARALEKATKEATAEQASRVGKYGGLRQTENKAIREAAAMESAGTLSPENADLLAKAKSSGRFHEALNEAMSNDLDFLANRTPEVAAAKSAMHEGAQGLPDAIQSRAAELSSPAAAKEQLFDRLKRYAPVAAGAVAGHFVPGMNALEGGAIGKVVQPGLQSFLRMMKNPAVQQQVWGALGPEAATAAEMQIGPAAKASLLSGLMKGKHLLPDIGFQPAAADDQKP